MSSRHFRPLKILYCLLGIALLLYSGYIVEMLVMHIWHKAPRGESADAAMTQKEKLFKDMLKGMETERGGGTYKGINAKRRLYDFHKTKKAVVLDAQDLCVSCHGDIPHAKKKETRAFLNMHASFVACETCHIRIRNNAETTYYWYNKISGETIEEPDLNRFLGNTLYKLMSVKKDGTRLYDNKQMIKYTAKFKSDVGTMTPAEKKTALEEIHRPMSDVKDSVKCEECHTSDRDNGYLPFKRIGYPDRRINQLVGNEVVGMIKKYKIFYMPNLLVPKEEVEREK